MFRRVISNCPALQANRRPSFGVNGSSIVLVICAFTLALSNFGFGQELATDGLSVDENKSHATVDSSDSFSVDFQQQVKPILSDYCFACHGPDSEHREADLRFDQLDEVVGDEGTVIPGDLDNSEFWQRIITDDEDMRMPPIDSHKELSAEDREILKRWIQQGANYEGHWAFESPTMPVVPVDAKSNHPIDAFINRQLQQQSLEPNPMADRRTLIRRLTLDLTGLPPTLQQIAEFENDTTADAYVSLVDRLLASPDYGQHMAVQWLDQARYADTNGYSIDGGRHMWLWRDWVINAYNSNLPYDQFVVQQMAGDLLPDATIQQKVATGFHRNHSITHEGGTIPEENLVNYVADRIKTTGETFLGLTLACAQCHDHKFDPVSQRDYYQFYAYFNSIDDRGLDGDAGRNSHPAIDAPWMIPGRDIEIAELDERLTQLKTKVAERLPSQVAWEQQQRQILENRGKDLEVIPVKLLKVTEPNRGEPFDVNDEGEVWVPTPSGRSPSFSMQLPNEKLQGKKITGIRVEFLADSRIHNGSIGHGGHPDLVGNFLLTSFSVSNTEVASDQIDLYRLKNFAQVSATSSHAGNAPSDCLDPRDHNGWAPADAKSNQHLTFTFDQPIDLSSPYLTAQMVWGAGYGLVASKYRFYVICGNDDGSPLPSDVQQILLQSDAERTEQQETRLAEYYATVAPELKNIQSDIQTISRRLQDLRSVHSTMVMNQSANPRKTHILNRGQYDQPGEEVTAATLGALPALGEFPANRLGLAQWLIHPQHPLTARVAVNRIWKQLMGRGLVHPTADFGAQGSPPTHPELLDYLAVSFIESGWDVKQLIRSIVTADAYRRSSNINTDQHQRDPENRWLSRASRFRLPAESIRDLTLHVSDQLVDRIGGPPVFPYQPSGLWREVSHFGSSPATSQVFVPDRGENLYRRSIYTYWKRTVPPPSMITFDAPNRETCTMDRSNTNTPLQALVLLNDVQFVEAARAFATRLLHYTPELQSDDDPQVDVSLTSAEPSSTEIDRTDTNLQDQARLIRGFELATSRKPIAAELAILVATLQRERENFRGEPDAAKGLVASGDSLLPEDIDQAELAAWTVVCQMILNLSETVTRG